MRLAFRQYAPFLIFAVAVTIMPMGAGAEHLVKTKGLIDGWNAEIDAVDEQLDNDTLKPLAIENLRRKLSDIIAAANRAQEKSRAHADDIEGLLNALGPPPGENDPPEAADVAEERKALQEQFKWHNGNVLQIALALRRAQHALSELGKHNRSQLTERLLKSTAPPVSGDMWRTAGAEFTRHFAAAFAQQPAAWVRSLSVSDELLRKVVYLSLLSLLFAIGVLPLRKWLRRRFGWRDTAGEPDYGDRLIAAVTEGACRGLIPVVFVIAVSLLIGDTDVTGYAFSVVIDSVAVSLAIFFFAYGVINATFSPNRPRWRIVNLGDVASRQLVWRLKVVLIVYLAFSGFRDAIDFRTISEEFDTVYALVFATSLYISIAALMRRTAWVSSEREAAISASAAGGATQSEDSATLVDRIRSLIAIGMLGLPLSAAVGYPYLAMFAADATVLTVMVLGCLWVARWLFRVGVASMTTADNPLAAWLRSWLALKQEGAQQLAFWVNMVVDLMLLVAASALLLPVWGYGAEEALVWLLQLFRGVQIGDFTFSLSDVILALLMFAAVMLITRLVQRGLDRHLLPNLVRDHGVRNALKTGVGYVGVIVAALVAISAVGLDLTNLALVAGALSVGLGFGLQNVVNNFVSGLILLIERPIKQGDWVVVGSHEGTVKNVNVRSTEIETFQRASVIIPNADLIATPVTNWTHKNHFGRVEILVGVSYDSDPEQVRDILLDIGRSHPEVMSDPDCSVYFRDFGASSLDFQLRCFLRDIDYFVIVVSDLRYAIFKRFKEEGIEIPFPQRVVHMAPSSEATPVAVPAEQALRESEMAKRGAQRGETAPGDE